MRFSLPMGTRKPPVRPKRTGRHLSSSGSGGLLRRLYIEKYIALSALSHDTFASSSRRARSTARSSRWPSSFDRASRARWSRLERLRAVLHRHQVARPQLHQVERVALGCPSPALYRRRRVRRRRPPRALPANRSRGRAARESPPSAVHFQRAPHRARAPRRPAGRARSGSKRPAASSARAQSSGASSCRRIDAAPRDDRPQQRAGRLRQQQEHRAVRRLFQRFQQRVLRAVVHPVGLLDDRDVPAALVGLQRQLVDQGADRVHADGVFPPAGARAGPGASRPAPACRPGRRRRASPRRRTASRARTSPPPCACRRRAPPVNKRARTMRPA